MPSVFWTWDFTDQLAWICDVFNNAVPGPGRWGGDGLAMLICFTLDYWPILLGLLLLMLLVGVTMRRI